MNILEQDELHAPVLDAVMHLFLRQISTIKSHDGGKEGYFGIHKVNSYHLQWTRRYCFSSKFAIFKCNKDKNNAPSLPFVFVRASVANLRGICVKI